MAEVRLMENLAKREFVRAILTYLGQVVGQGHVCPIDAKLQAVQKYPVPTSKKELMPFLGLEG